MDPSGIGDKAAQEMLRELQQQQNQLESNQDPSADGASFQDSLQAQNAQDANRVEGLQESKQIDGIQDAGKATNVIQQAMNRKSAVQPATSTVVGASEEAKQSKVANMIEQLVNGQDKMADIMKLAMSGKKLDSQQMLAMQAGIYRFSQELELTSKVVEKATSGIKQTMNTQV